MVLGVGIVLSLGFLDAPDPARSAPALAADPSKAAVVQGWLDARNRDDQDAAAAMLADTLFYIGTGGAACSLQTPCYDRDSVHASNSRTDANFTNHCYKLTEFQVAGNIVTGRFDIRGDSYRAAGIERTIAAFMADVVDDKIVWIVQRQDTGDSQTALWYAINAGTAQRGTPLPTPDPPC
jgi:hypothetical protein